jgi:broad specificity phosphatase PhoE
MAVFIIRHSDKEAGEFRTAGLPLNDQPLSAAGRARAAALGGFFGPLDIASIRVSEYIRTRQTIEAVADAKGLSMETDPRLNEIDIGCFESLDEAGLELRYPDFWSAFLARDRDFRFPGGESGEEASSRALAAFHSLDRAGNHILVAHDGLIRVLVCGLLGLPPYRRHLFAVDYCSVTEFAYEARFGSWTLKSLNQAVSR